MLHISGRGISAVAALVTGRMQLNARKHQDLNAKIPKSPGDSSKHSSNWEQPKLIRSRASVNILHKLAPRTCRTERGCAGKKKTKYHRKYEITAFVFVSSVLTIMSDAVIQHLNTCMTPTSGLHCSARRPLFTH